MPELGPKDRDIVAMVAAQLMKSGKGHSKKQIEKAVKDAARIVAVAQAAVAPVPKEPKPKPKSKPKPDEAGPPRLNIREPRTLAEKHQRDQQPAEGRIP